MPWTLLSHTEAEVVLRTVIYPHTGWRGVLELTIGHSLDDDGLRVSVDARNVGSNRLPYGYGAHPYLAADLATAELRTAFTKELFVDDRLLPRQISVVTEQYDFRESRAIGDVTFDTAFLGADDWAVSVTSNGRTTTFWADETLPWGQIYTTPERDAIAIEPMTCGPDAYNEGPTHDSLIVLEPGQLTTSVWGIRVS